MRDATETVEALPKGLPECLELVGTRLFGREWQAQVAAGLGVHRATLWRWMAGKRPQHDVDHDLIELLERERERQDYRALQITALRKLFVKRATTTKG
jgi:hypothetical protein